MTSLDTEFQGRLAQIQLKKKSLNVSKTALLLGVSHVVVAVVVAASFWFYAENSSLTEDELAHLIVAVSKNTDHIPADLLEAVENRHGMKIDEMNFIQKQEALRLLLKQSGKQPMNELSVW